MAVDGRKDTPLESWVVCGADTWMRNWAGSLCDNGLGLRGCGLWARYIGQRKIGLPGGLR